MSLKGYFDSLEKETELDGDFDEELNDHPADVAAETAESCMELDQYRCRRLARLLRVMEQHVRTTNVL